MGRSFYLIEASTETYAQILKFFPAELGDILLCTPSVTSGGPSFASGQGVFSLKGVSLNLLSQKLHEPGELRELLQCDMEQAMVFRYMQKSLNTPIRLKRLSDVIRYMTRFR
jgi:hypothetical protein